MFLSAHSVCVGGDSTDDDDDGFLEIGKGRERGVDLLPEQQTAE